VANPCAKHPRYDLVALARSFVPQGLFTEGYFPPTDYRQWFGDRLPVAPGSLLAGDLFLCFGGVVQLGFWWCGGSSTNLLAEISLGR